MRLHILSDLHLEFAPFVPPATEADIVLLAGDIDLGIKGVTWAKRTWPDRPVIYVAGNHEYYRHTLPVLNRHLQEETAGTNVHFLENSEIICNGIRFIGCVLWTDFEAFGTGESTRQAMDAAACLMADYRVIRAGLDSGVLTPNDTRRLHKISRQFLEDALARPFAGPTVIVTHHAPSINSAAERHRQHATTAAFVSTLDDLVTRSGAVMWVHGHTHHGVDYHLGTTRVLSNQRGYPNENVGRFDAGLTVDI
jgi:hypothetical protein